MIKTFIWRILIGIFGATAFFNISNKESLFYNADCDKTNTFFSTIKSFTGDCKDGSNNGVHHTAVKDDNGLLGCVIMAENQDGKVDIGTAKATLIIFEKACSAHCNTLKQSGTIITSMRALMISLKYLAAPFLTQAMSESRTFLLDLRNRLSMRQPLVIRYYYTPRLLVGMAGL